VTNDALGFFSSRSKRSRLEKSGLIHENKLPSLSLLRTFVKGKPFVGELQVRDVIYKTVVVKLPVLVPGGLCAPPRRIECPCLAVLRADAKQLKACKGKACVLYLHGNGTDIGGAAEEAKTLARELDCHVLVPEYPGYGLAEGESSEDSVDAATHSAVRFAVETLGVPHERLVIYGRSVGTGPAAAAAARMTALSPLGPPAALVLHSPYTSILEYAREKAGGLLSYLLVSERWPTRSNLTKVGCPTLLIHGDRDEVIPFRHSAKLRKDAAKRANAQKGGAAERRDRTSDRGSNDSGSPRGETPRRETGSAQTGLVQLHVQKNASHNVFDCYGDVADPIASFLKRHERAPWRAGGEQREPMGLDLRHLDARVQQAGPGEMEEYPFASAAV
jgi:pimeloyl-ACP methyl ester carboxylesterase